MTANFNPVYSLTANVAGATPTAANTQSGGVGTIATDIFKAFTAGAEGAYVSRMICTPFATVAATATTATVIRVFLSSKTSGATTAADTMLIAEAAVASQSADSSTTAVIPTSIPINMAIPANYTILVTLHAAPAANTGWHCVVAGGNW